MKKLFVFFAVVFLSGFNFAQEQVLDSFDKMPTDTSYWHKLVGYPDTDSLKINYITSPVKVGDGAMKVDYKVIGHDDWGGFVGMEHWNPDSTGTYDLSSWDSLSFWYYIDKAIPASTDMILRFCLFDVSNSPNKNKTYVQTECEKYFSFHDILKQDPGWHYLSIPLVNNDNVSGKGFALRTWGGCQEGNKTLDLDKIKGWIFEFIVNTQQETPFRGSIIVDHMALKGLGKQSMIYFNGKTIPGNVNLFQGRAGSVKISNEETSNPATHLFSLKWNTPGQWDGPIFTFAKPANMKFFWDTDSLKFKIKAPAGFGDLRIVFANPDEHLAVANAYGFEAAYLLKADDMAYDNTWKTVKIPLRSFDKFAGVWVDSLGITVGGVMDVSKISDFKILVTNDTRGQNKVVYLDEIWTGNPVFDVMPPQAPTQIAAFKSTSYVNLVTWVDVPGEEGETYNVYASTKPITDISSKDVDVVAKKVVEKQQQVEHVLLAPETDQDISYYYAVVCVDAAGNESNLAASAVSTTNTARGVPIINTAPPATFKADGNLSEWKGMSKFRVHISDGTGHVTDGTGLFIKDDNDLSIDGYLAMDKENLYVAWDVTDDVVFEDSTQESYLIDGVDLFLGLYDQRGETHVSYQKGSECDYHLRFVKQAVILDQDGGFIVMYPNSNYFWGEKFPAGYTVEAKIPFAKLSSLLGSDLFTPKTGMRIPIDIIGNDNDGTAQGRKGILTYSAKSNDQSYRDVSVWFQTWIGSQWTDVKNETINNQVITSYNLSQNYPNPFNPSTVIKYNLAKTGHVTVKVFDVLGREIATLVNSVQNPGAHSLRFDAGNLTSGMYIYKIEAGDFTSVKKMMLIK